MKQSFWDLSAVEARCERLARLLADAGLVVSVQTGRAEPVVRASRKGSDRVFRADPLEGGFVCLLFPRRGDSEPVRRRKAPGPAGAVRLALAWLPAVPGRKGGCRRRTPRRD